MSRKEQAIASIREFNRFYTNIIGIVNQHILESPYSLSEVRVLYEINYNHNCTAKSIKSILQIDEGYLSRIMEKFVKKILVKKIQSPDDGRVYILSLTAKGKKEFDRLNEAAELSIAEVVNRLPQNDLQDLMHMMTGIRRILSQ